MQNDQDMQQGMIPVAIQFPQLKMVAISAGMQQVVTQMRKVAKIKYQAVLLTGETGVGKQEVAQGIHATALYYDQRIRHREGRSPSGVTVARETPFEKIDCASISHSIL